MSWHANACRARYGMHWNQLTPSERATIAAAVEGAFGDDKSMAIPSRAWQQIDECMGLLIRAPRWTGVAQREGAKA